MSISTTWRRWTAHDLGVAVVGAGAFAEVGQLLGHVGRVLAAQVRKPAVAMPTPLGEWQPVQAGMPSAILPPRNSASPWATRFRIGHADAHLLAGEVGGDVRPGPGR